MQTEVKTNLVTYTVYGLDVWAGEKKGLWDKMNFFDEGLIALPEGPDQNKIIETLIKEGYLTEEFFDKVIVEDINNMCEYFHILRKCDNYPIFDLKLLP